MKFNWLKIKKVISWILNSTTQFLKIIWIFLRKVARAFVIMTHLERIALTILLLAVIVLLGFKAKEIYYKNTKIQPIAGGNISFSATEVPKTLIPIFAQSDIERAITNLVFAPLVQVNINGKVSNYLAKNWDISKNYKTYTLTLKDGIKWQDSKTVTADDVVYTFSILKSPKYKGPYEGIFKDIDIQALNEKQVKFVLKNPYQNFLTTLEIGILPSHILGDKPLADLQSLKYNLEPIGAGPYQIKTSTLNGKDKKIVLTRFKNALIKSKIDKIEFHFYEDFQGQLYAYNKKQANAFFSIPNDQFKTVKNLPKTKIVSDNLASYNVIHLNLARSLMQIMPVREALTYGVNRKEIIDKVFYGQAISATGPIVNGIKGYIEQENIEDQKLAYQKLIDAGFSDSDKDGVLEKKDQKLEFKMVVIETPVLKAAADILVEQYKKIGVKISPTYIQSSILESTYLKDRDYDMILVGESLGSDVDLYPYWHSTQTEVGGYNFSNFQNENIDKYLEQLRGTEDITARRAILEKIQKVIYGEKPAVYLTQPIYSFALPDKVKGVNRLLLIDGSEIFKNVCNWYEKIGRGPK